MCGSAPAVLAVISGLVHRKLQLKENLLVRVDKADLMAVTFF